MDININTGEEGRWYLHAHTTSHPDRVLERAYDKELYNNIPRIKNSIREQGMRFTGHCWRSKNKLVGMCYYGTLNIVSALGRQREWENYNMYGYDKTEFSG